MPPGQLGRVAVIGGSAKYVANSGGASFLHLFRISSMD